MDNLKDEIITLNHNSGFFNDTLEIKITKNRFLPKNAQIFYTLDGNDPTKESRKYENKIELKIEEDTTIYPLKMIVFYDDSYSKIIEKTYVLDKNIQERYDLSVVSVTTDEKNLYDHETGIFVAGITNEEKKNSQDPEGNYDNRGEEWERDGFLTMFDREGNILLEQDIDLAVSGNSSAGNEIKSLRVSAKENEKFQIDFYQENQISQNSMPIEYKSLRLRAGSTDTFYGNIRSSLGSILANQSNFDGCTTTKRTIVYLNGTYYGIFDMQQTYAKNYLKNKFGLEESDKIVRYKNEEIEENTDLKSYFLADLEKKENRESLERIFDMDNYLLYFALEILMNNTDWPANNIEMWKYTGTLDENNHYTDGRYRYLLFDLDGIYYSYGDTETNSMDVLVDLLDEKKNEEYKEKHGDGTYGVYFRNVMQSSYYRDKFVTIVSDLLNTSFKAENVIQILEEEYNKIKKETERNTNKEILRHIESSLARMEQKITKRESEIKAAFTKYLGLKNRYTLELNGAEGIEVSWNHMHIYSKEKYKNRYYEDVKFTLNAKSYPGYEFEYWIVNGQKIEEESLAITKELIKEGKIEIDIMAKKKEANLIISEISAKSDSDWIKLTNNSEESIQLKEYYLSDDKHNLKKYNLPNKTISSGESIYIHGDKNYYAIGAYICNFNLSNGETLYLAQEEKIIDELYVPKMNKYESFGRKDNSNTLVYFYNRNQERK